MAEQSYQISLDFTTRGLKNIENSVVALVKDTEKLAKATQNSFGTGSSQYSDMGKKVDELNHKLVGLFKRIQETSQAIAQDGEDIDGGQVARYQKQMIRFSRELGGMQLQVKGFGQAYAASSNGITSNILENIKYLQQLGVQAKDVDVYFKKLAVARNTAETTGDTSQLSRTNSELQKTITTVKSIETAITKLNSLQLQPKAVQSEASRLTDLKGGVVSGQVSPQMATIELQKTSVLTSEILAKEALLSNKRKESTSELNAAKRVLETQARSLEATLRSQKGVASPAEYKALETHLASVKNQLTQISQMKEPEVLSPQRVSYYTRSVEKAVEATKQLSGATPQLAFDTKTSKSFSDAARGATELHLELRNFKQTASSIVSGVLPDLGRQLSALYTGSKNKTLAPSVTKEELDSINKKISLLKDLDALQKKADSYGDIMNAEDLAVVNVEISNLVGKVKDANVNLPAMAQKVRDLSKAFTSKVNIDASYKQLEVSYQKQIESLQRLINTKSKLANNSDIKAAKAQVLELESALRGVKGAAEQASADFAIDPDGTLTKSTGELRKLNTELESSSKRAKELGTNLSKTDNLKWFTNIAQRAAAYTAAFGGMYMAVDMMKRGVQYALEYDQAVHTLAAVLDMTADSAGRLEARLAKLGVRFGGSLKDINEAALTLGRAGFDKSEIADATENIIKMARLTGDTYATSASALITYKEVYGDVVDSVTKSTPSVEDLGDMLAYMANQSRMSTQDIGTFSNYALAAAKSAGMTSDAVSAMAISFSNAGVNASTIGTQIRRFSSVLAETSSETVNFFRSMGVSQEMFMARLKMGTKESDKAMAEFVMQLKGMSDSEFSAITRGMDILALQSLTLLRNNADEFMKHLTTLNAGVQGEIEKSAYITESYAITWEKLGNALGESFNKVLSAALPVAKEITDTIIDMFKVFSTNLSSVNQNSAAFFSSFKSNLAIIAGAGGLLLVLNNLTKIGAVLRGITAASSAGGAFSALAGGLGFVAKEAGGAAAGLANAKEKTTLLSLGLGVISRHPIIMLLGAIATAAYFATDAIKGTKNASESLNLETQLTNAQDLVRNASAAFKSADSEAARQQALKDLNTAQKMVANLTAQVGLNGAILDASSTIRDAKTYASVYSKNETPNAGESSQTSGQIVNALDSLKTAFNTTMKSLPADREDDRKILTTYIADLENKKKEVQGADFLKPEVKAQMSNVTDYLDGMEATLKKFSYSVNKASDELERAYFSPKQYDQFKNVLRVEASQEGVTKDAMSSPSALKNQSDIAVMLSQISNLRALQDGKITLDEKSKILSGEFEQIQLQVTSWMRDASIAKPGSAHITGEAVDFQVGDKSLAATEELVALMRQNQKAIPNLGKVLLETKRDNDGKETYWVHMETAARSGGVPSFKYLDANTNKSSLFNGAAPIPGSGTDVRQPVSPEYLENVKGLVANLESMYRSGEDISQASGRAIADLKTTLDRLDGDLKHQIAAIQKGSTTDAAKELAGILDKNQENLKDPTQFNSVMMQLRGRADELSVGADAATLTSINGVLQASKQLEASSKNIHDMRTSLAKLNNLGTLELQEQYDITKDLNKFNADMVLLKQKLAESETALSYATTGRVHAESKIEVLNRNILAIKQEEIANADRLGNLYQKLAENERQINEYIKNNTKDEALLKKLKEEHKDINQKIEDTTKNILNLEKKSVQATTDKNNALATQFTAIQQIRAEFSDFMNDTTIATQNFKQMAEYQKLVASGVSPQEASGMISAKGEKTRSDFQKYDQTALSLGTAGFEGWQTPEKTLKAVNEKYTTQQGTVSSDLGVEGAAYQDAQTAYDTNLALLQQNGMAELEAKAMLAEQEKALVDQKNAYIANSEKAAKEAIGLEEQKLTALKNTQFNMWVSQGQSATSSLLTIADTYYKLSGNKSKTAFKLMQAMQIAETTITTYKNAVAAYGSLAPIPFVGPALGIAAAAAAVAMGLQQVAAIKSQTYHTGGYVYDDNRAGLRSDEVPAVLQTGEYVLSRNDLKAINETSKSSPAAPAASSSEVVIVNSLDPTVVEQYLTSRAGRQVINNAIKR